MSSQGKLFESCGMYMSSSVHLGKVVFKLRYVSLITCLSGRKLF